MNRADSNKSGGAVFETCPEIPLVPEEVPRPFWSVMVPTYNCRPAYLRNALESVLRQDPGLD